MSNPVFAWILIGAGVLVVLISAFADPMGLGRSPGFGWRQTLGVIIGGSGRRGRALLAAPAEGYPLGAVPCPGARRHARYSREGEGPPSGGALRARVYIPPSLGPSLGRAASDSWRQTR
jgi:hypothetical protein